MIVKREGVAMIMNVESTKDVLIPDMEGSHYFSSSFEKRKTLEYLNNLINSKFLHSIPIKLFSFSRKILGLETTISLLNKHFPEIISNKKFDEWIEQDQLDSNIPRNILIEFLSKTVAPLFNRECNEKMSSLDSDIEARLDVIKVTFSLTTDEIEILSFFYIFTACEFFKDFLDSIKHANFEKYACFKSVGHIILGHEKKSFMHFLSKTKLFKMYIMEKAYRGEIELYSWCLDYLSGYGEMDLSFEFFTKENTESLQISDFNVSDDEKNVLKTLIESKSRQNILFYGVPGTGKSSFARCVSKAYKQDLYTVKIPEEDSHESRLRNIYATLKFAEKNNAIVLIDEADEVLNSCNSFFYKSKTNKSFVNNLLESHQKKLIWITNRAKDIDSSTMRRFTFSVEFKKFKTADRLKVIRKEIRKQNLNDYFDEEELQDICRTYSVNAGGIVDAINTIKMERKTNKETIIKNVRTLLGNHEKVTLRNEKGNVRSGRVRNYSLEGLNTSRSLDNVLSAVTKYNEYNNDNVEEIYSIKMLLHGIPGTGKSEFVYYMGALLNREVLLKRCSMIKSKWVGETEKNIADAFSEAQANDSILFFDEADSLLFPRKESNHSWEKSMTNEILTQMDSYSGMVVFATNDMTGLDHAAFRRFQFKIEFLPLTSEGNIKFYNSILKPLISKNHILTDKDINSIQNIRNLTPGDFAIVKEQCTFMDQSQLTHQQLIESLLCEVRHKVSDKRITGFAVIDR
jgi:transitional endoplasmic reticulum ATPase